MEEATNIKTYNMTTQQKTTNKKQKTPTPYIHSEYLKQKLDNITKHYKKTDGKGNTTKEEINLHEDNPHTLVYQPTVPYEPFETDDITFNIERTIDELLLEKQAQQTKHYNNKESKTIKEIDTIIYKLNILRKKVGETGLYGVDEIRIIKQKE